jgi:hypothetical protein
MFRRTLMAFILCTLALATMAAAQPGTLLFHHRVFQGREIHQAAAMLPLPVPANGWATSAELRDAQVQAAVDWFVSHGYFDDPVDVDFVSGSDGNSLSFNGPGIHIVIHLPSGPFLPTQREQLLAATIIRISNGF